MDFHVQAQKARCGGAGHPQTQQSLGGWGMRNMDSESAWATQWDPVSKKKEELKWRFQLDSTTGR